MSATTSVQLGHAWWTMSVNFAAAFGSRDVGCEKWLASFHGASTFTDGKAARNALIAVSYCLAVGSLQILVLKYFFWPQREASPRECSNATSGSTPAARAAARYCATRV